MGRIADLLFGARRDETSSVQMVGVPSQGLISSVTPLTTLGLSAVWRCLDILANGVSQLEWRERRGSVDVPASRLVQRPQAQRTRREWTSLVVSTLALYDVCYLMPVGGPDGEGVPLGLWYLDPTLVRPATTDLYTDVFLLPPEEFYIGSLRVPRERLVILHRSPQPSVSDDVGGVLNLARTTFASALAAERYASRYWQAGGAPTTVLETEQRLTDQQIADTSARWADRRAKGPDHAPVLSGGLKARSFGADPTSEAAVEARKEMVADIGRYFGIPTRILNAPTGDSETYATTESGNQDLVRYTLQNYIGAIQDAISDTLPGIRRMEMDTWTLTAGTQYTQAQAFQIATGSRPWMTPAEVRERTGLPPIEHPLDLPPTGV